MFAAFVTSMSVCRNGVTSCPAACKRGSKSLPSWPADPINAMRIEVLSKETRRRAASLGGIERFGLLDDEFQNRDGVFVVRLVAAGVAADQKHFAIKLLEHRGQSFNAVRRDEYVLSAGGDADGRRRVAK